MTMKEDDDDTEGSGVEFVWTKIIWEKARR
jgi:hypothetical protein